MWLAVRYEEREGMERNGVTCTFNPEEINEPSGCDAGGGSTLFYFAGKFTRLLTEVPTGRVQGRGRRGEGEIN